MFRDATSQAMTTDVFCDACLLEKNCHAALAAGAQNLNHKMESKNGIQKRDQIF